MKAVIAHSLWGQSTHCTVALCRRLLCTGGCGHRLLCVGCLHMGQHEEEGCRHRQQGLSSPPTPQSMLRLAKEREQGLGRGFSCFGWTDLWRDRRLWAFSSFKRESV
jgi:hypothetical protein